MISDLSLWDIVKDVKDTFNYKDNVALYNENFEKYAHENRTQNEMFLSELAGYIDANSDAIREVNAAIFFKEYGRYPTKEEIHADRLPELIYNLIRLGKITNELPVLHIVPTLHAWTRWIKKPFKDGNDTIDFYHACFALPYCDYFFTDRRLCSAIKETKLNIFYGCVVEHNAEEVLRILESM